MAYPKCTYLRLPDSLRKKAVKISKETDRKLASTLRLLIKEAIEARAGK